MRAKKKTVVIQTTVTAEGQPDIVWFKGSTRYPRTGPVTGHVEQVAREKTTYSVFLEISDANEQDVGEYKVVAKHNRKEVTESVRCTDETVK